MKLILNAKADLNIKDKNEKTPIFYSCEKGHTESIGLLLKNKASLNVQDVRKKSVFHHLQFHQKYQVLELLINENFDVNMIDDDGNNMLINECRKKGPNMQLIQTLLKKKADPNHKNKLNNSSITYAQMYKDKQLLKLFGVELIEEPPKEKKLNPPTKTKIAPKPGMKTVDLESIADDLSNILVDLGKGMSNEEKKDKPKASPFFQKTAPRKESPKPPKIEDKNQPEDSLDIAANNIHMINKALNELKRDTPTLNHGETPSCNPSLIKDNTPLVESLNEKLFHYASELDIQNCSYYLSTGASVNFQDGDGNTCLHILCSHHKMPSIKLIDLFLSGGSNLYITNKQNRFHYNCFF